jgi:hypothetical protein
MRYEDAAADEERRKKVYNPEVWEEEDDCWDYLSEQWWVCDGIWVDWKDISWRCERDR